MTQTTSHWHTKTESPEETQQLGQLLGEVLTGNLVVGLCGPLGAGKTEFVKGVAAGNANGDGAALGVTSPTFTLINEYPGTLTLYHLDAYRLESPDALRSLGFDELATQDSAVLVEWADRVVEVLPTQHLSIAIAPSGSLSREFSFSAFGPTAIKCLEAIRKSER